LRDASTEVAAPVAVGFWLSSTSPTGLCGPATLQNLDNLMTETDYVTVSIAG
jgi:hypothetical protein